MRGLGGSIRRWHWGKVVIVWAWGVVLAALFLTAFLQSGPTDKTPLASSVTFAGSLVILLGLTTITWVWLGGKEQ